MDNEVSGGKTGAVYDYGFRIYDARINRFLSLDPLSRNFPWNSPYSYAENDVIRSIDLDGLEKVAVIYSPYNAARIKELMQTSNYKKVMKIIDYSTVHGWVDNNGQPSDYIHRKVQERYGKHKDNPLPIESSAHVFDTWEDPELVEKYGDINDHGGYMEVSFYNWKTKEFEDLGILPLAKTKEHEEFTIYKDDESFWGVEPIAIRLAPKVLIYNIMY